MARNRDYTLVWVVIVLVAIILAFQFWPRGAGPVTVDPPPPTVSADSRSVDVALQTLPITTGTSARRVVHMVETGDYDLEGWPWGRQYVGIWCDNGGMNVLVTAFDTPVADSEPPSHRLSSIRIEVAPANARGSTRTAKTVTYSSADLKPVGKGAATAASFPAQAKPGASTSDLPFGKRLIVRVRPSDVGMVDFVPGTALQLRVMRL
jgi:hypothetical protein